MSISHKKINQMIESSVEDLNGFGRDKEKFINLCKKIYLLESSLADSGSSASIIARIRDEIIHLGSDLKEDK